MPFRPHPVVKDGELIGLNIARRLSSRRRLMELREKDALRIIRGALAPGEFCACSLWLKCLLHLDKRLEILGLPMRVALYPGTFDRLLWAISTFIGGATLVDQTSDRVRSNRDRDPVRAGKRAPDRRECRKLNAGNGYRESLSTVGKTADQLRPLMWCPNDYSRAARCG